MRCDGTTWWLRQLDMIIAMPLQTTISPFYFLCPLRYRWNHFCRNESGLLTFSTNPVFNIEKNGEAKVSLLNDGAKRNHLPYLKTLSTLYTRALYLRKLVWKVAYLLTKTQIFSDFFRFFQNIETYATLWPMPSNLRKLVWKVAYFLTKTYATLWSMSFELQ